MGNLSTESFLFLGHKLYRIKSASKIFAGFFALFLFALPSLGFAQSGYYTSGNTFYYPSYQCGDSCGFSESYNFTSAPSSPRSYSFAQMAGVAAAFQPSEPVAVVAEVIPPKIVNQPQLPKTGGGGKALEEKFQINPFYYLAAAALFLISTTFTT